MVLLQDRYIAKTLFRTRCIDDRDVGVVYWSPRSPCYIYSTNSNGTMDTKVINSVVHSVGNGCVTEDRREALENGGSNVIKTPDMNHRCLMPRKGRVRPYVRWCSTDLN